MLRKFALIISLVFCAGVASAQRNVTPVDVDDKKPAQPSLHYYDKHGEPLDQPVLFLAALDTIDGKKATPGPVYPRISAVTFGLNFCDGIMALAGQNYGGFDLWAELSLWNWISPVVELGVGTGKETPDGNNYTYKGKPAPYFKLGFNYNFLYKSNPDYQVFAGFRAGFSSFKFDLTDISVNADYWAQHQRFSLCGFSSSALYGEALVGIKVKLIKQFSLGWTLRYKFLFNNKPATLAAVQASGGAPYDANMIPNGAEASPWYIPGYGARKNHLGATFSLIYTIPLNKHKYPQPDAPAPVDAPPAKDTTADQAPAAPEETPVPERLPENQ